MLSQLFLIIAAATVFAGYPIVERDYRAVESQLQSLRQKISCDVLLVGGPAPTTLKPHLIAAAREYLSKALPVAPFVMNAAELIVPEFLPQYWSEIEVFGEGESGIVVCAKIYDRKYAIKIYSAKILKEKAAVPYVYQQVLGALGVTPQVYGVITGPVLQKLVQHVGSLVDRSSILNTEPTYAVVTDLIEDAYPPVDAALHVREGRLDPLSLDEKTHIQSRVSYIVDVIREMGFVPVDDQSVIDFSTFTPWLLDVDGYYWSHDHMKRDSFYGWKIFSRVRERIADEQLQFSLGLITTPEVARLLQRPWDERSHPTNVTEDARLLLESTAPKPKP